MIQSQPMPPVEVVAGAAEGAVVWAIAGDRARKREPPCSNVAVGRMEMLLSGFERPPELQCPRRLRVRFSRSSSPVLARLPQLAVTSAAGAVAQARAAPRVCQGLLHRPGAAPCGIR